jgi:hypothetical protein
VFEGIGLEDHEAPYLRGGTDDVIRTGNAFSNEPGVYIEGKVQYWRCEARDFCLIGPTLTITNRSAFALKTASTSTKAEILYF